MKSAKIFMIGMYLHLIFSIAIPFMIVLVSSEGWGNLSMFLFIGYLIFIVAVLIMGWICVGIGVSAYRQSEYAKLRKGLKLLKLGTIPFYILNFIYSVVVWFIIIGASRGILVILAIIPILITCTMIVQSGCIGICYIKYLRQKNQGKPHAIHYFLQLISVFDVISTLIILHKYREN